MENNELQHWGIKGMKWGVRRYQNSDGTLTAAGKKRYRTDGNLKKNGDSDKTSPSDNRSKTSSSENAPKVLSETEKYAKEKAAYEKGISDMTDEEPISKVRRVQMEKQYRDIKPGPPEPKEPTYSNIKKPVSEMSDDELAKAIERSRMEKTYRELNPEKISLGEKYLEKLKDGALDKATSLALNIGHDYIDKVARDTLGLSKKDDASESEKLAQKLKDLKNQKEIDELNDSEYQNLKKESSKAELEKKIREGEKAKAEAEKAKAEAEKSKTKSEADDKVHEGEVVGEGTSKATKNKSGPTVDADVTVSNLPSTIVDSGRNYTEDFLRRFKYNR